jgi:hypothetical protein
MIHDTGWPIVGKILPGSRRILLYESLPLQYAPTVKRCHGDIIELC